MKKIIISILSAAAIVCLADEAQKMPQAPKEIFRERLIMLTNVKAIQVVDNQWRKGVVCHYDNFCTKLNLYKRPCDIGFAGYVEQNKSFERIFITGLDHDKITTNGKVYHRKEWSWRGDVLFVWRIGIEKLTAGGREVRLKKFTVDHKQAEAYWKKK